MVDSCGMFGDGGLLAIHGWLCVLDAMGHLVATSPMAMWHLKLLLAMKLGGQTYNRMDDICHHSSSSRCHITISNMAPGVFVFH